MVDPVRIRAVNAGPVERRGEYVLYWMIASRRVRFNPALERAVEWSRELARPLLVLEAVRCDYPWASERLHAFILEGMADNAERTGAAPVLYHPYVEPRRRAGRGLLAALAKRACVVVTDDYPAFFLPSMIEAAGRRLRVRLEAVDGCGLLPMRKTERVFGTAAAFRRYLARELPPHLRAAPTPSPLEGLRGRALSALPDDVLERWPAADPLRVRLAELPIDHEVAKVALRGGARAAEAELMRFLEHGLARYGAERNQPEAEATSHLSPWLHFGHISPHEIHPAVRRNPAFVDQLVTWRELAFNLCANVPNHDAYASLPEWARRTLDGHRADPRPFVYDRRAFENARTHDPLWNAAMRQLRREGWFHGYMRILWAKKILEWSRSPQTAFRLMIDLMNRWSLDGRDPNTWAGASWVLGRWDRPFGPERAVYGRVRYVSSRNWARKVRVRGYLARYA